jgi:hypothetical protein
MSDAGMKISFLFQRLERWCKLLAVVLLLEFSTNIKVTESRI